MNTIDVDVAVLGAGSAGLTAFRAAGTHTDRALLIESGQYGTTCARVGCMPSKLLIAAANVAQGVRDAGRFGIQARLDQVDGQAVLQRLRAERDRFTGFVVEQTLAIPEHARLRGEARFLAADRLQVGDTMVCARTVVMATGSRPFIPEVLQAAGNYLSTSEDVFEWNALPESVAVVGAGNIGLELGQALHRLGVKVAIFGRGARAGFLDDPALAARATSLFASELDLRLHCDVVGVDIDHDSDKVLLTWRQGDGSHAQARFSRILCATGRVPVLPAGLDQLGLQCDDRGVPLFDPLTMRCGESSIFIAGDASNALPLLHEAVDQGRIAGDNAGAWPQARPGNRHLPLSIAFTEPQLAQVGLSSKALEGRDVVVGKADFAEQGRSRVMQENRGALHVYAERGSGRLLGAQMVGPRAEHLAHLLAWALQMELTVGQALKMPFYHPVVEESLRTAFKDARDQMRDPPSPLVHCDDCTPGV